LIFCAGYYRLLGVASHIFPADPRRRGRRDTAPEQRSPARVTSVEILTLVTGLPLWLALAWLWWRWLERRQTALDIDDRWWQLMVLAWLFGVVAVVASALLRYAAQGQMRPEEATLFLQDTLWRETSREQRRINRWITWARRRSRRKEEI